MGLHLQGLIGEWSEPRCFYVDDIILYLQDTSRENELAANDR
jgi:hypothetical protein